MATLVTHAMVLAAGKGTRMGDISNKTPKPLVEVAGISLLDRVLDHVVAAGIDVAVVNVHHLADQIEDHLLNRENGPNIIISDEREMLLETGGGVLSALEALGDSPFVVINSDALWVDGASSFLKTLAATFDDEKMDCLLGLVATEKTIGFEGAGDFFMDEKSALKWRGAEAKAPWVFSGIQILSPRLFEGEMLGKWSLKRLYDKAEAEERLYGVPMDGEWMHVGTPEGVEEATKRLKQLAGDL